MDKNPLFFTNCRIVWQVFCTAILQLSSREIVGSLLTTFPPEMGQENDHSDSSEKAHPP